MPCTCKTVRDVFEEAQRGFQHHAKLIRALKEIQDGFSSQDEFIGKFIDNLRHAMIVFKREPAVERIIDFVAKYSTSDVHYQSLKLKDDNQSDGEDTELDNPFLQTIVAFILNCHDAKDKAVRYRCCQLIHKILSNMDDEACIDDDMADSILKHMLKRLTDKIPQVRVQAVYALSRLQDPTDKECPVITPYLLMMATDASADVRKAVLLNIALNRKSLGEIIARTHDVAESVRKIAYCIIGEKVKVQLLSIAVRVQLLQDGLNDRSTSIQNVCAKSLLQGWLKSFQGKVVDLLKSLDIENSSDTAEKAVKVILNGMTRKDLQDQIKILQYDSGTPVSIPYSSLDCESAFYWRCLGQHFKSLGVEGEGLLDQLLQEVSGFCEYFQGYIDLSFTTVPEFIDGKVMQQAFVAQQLLMLLGVVDLSDEVGRERLVQLIHDTLVSPYIPGHLVEVLLARHSEIQPDEESRIQELVEVIADVRQPIITVESAASKEEQRQKELKLASIKVNLMQLNDDLESCIGAQDFAKAAEIKQQISEYENERSAINESTSSTSMAVREEKDDPATLLKCLTIASVMLQSVTRNGLNPTLMTLVDTLVLPGIQNEDPEVRNAATKCLGLCALLSCEFARNHLVLFLQVAQVDLEIVQLTALQTVFDLVLKFGLEAFKLNVEKGTEKPCVQANERDALVADNTGNSNNAPDTTAVSVLNILTEQIDSESDEIRIVAAEGLAKLLLSGRVLSAKLLSRLILLWYNPTTEEDNHLRHCIGVFLPIFAFASRSNQEIVEEAFLPILKTLFSAPSSSPLAAINSTNVAELLIELTNSKRLNSQPGTTTTEGCSHIALALKVANDILTDPQAPGTRVLCKVLTLLDLDGCDQTSVGDLKVLVHQLFQALEDTACTKLIDKLQKPLDEIESANQDEVEATIDKSNHQKKTNEACDEERTVAPSSSVLDQQGPFSSEFQHNNANRLEMDNQSQSERLRVYCATHNPYGTHCHESVVQQAKEKERSSAKTPKSKSTRKKKANTAYNLVANVSTAKKTRPKRNIKSISTVVSRLNLSDSETSDKENAVF